MNRTPVPSFPGRSTRPALTVGVALALALTFAVSSTSAAATAGLVPTTALANAALSIPQQPQTQQAQQGESPDLRAAASRDSEIIKDLVYMADGQQQATDQQPADDRQPYELSLLDAVELALRNNLQVQVARYNPQSSFEGINGARGQFDPTLSFSVPGGFSRGSSPTTNQTAGGDIITTQGLNGGFQWSENLQWGTNYNISWNSNRTSTNSQVSTFNPSLTTNLRGSINQPLLRGFGDVNKTSILVSMNSYDQSLEQFRGTVQNIIAQVVQAYWSLRAQTEALAVRQEALRLAEQQLERNRIQVEIGTLAPIETVQAETQQANSRLNLIQTQNSLETAQDTLKEAINFDAVVDDPFAYRLVPTEDPEQEVAAVDVNEAIQTALDNDPTLASQRIGLRTAELNLRQAQNNLLPSLNVNASFSMQGRGGTRLIRGGDFGGEVVEVISTPYTTALSQMLSGDFNTWSVGATLTLPIYNRSAKASAARSQISQRQALTQYEQRRQSITYDVRQQVRNIQNLVQQVENATLSRQLADRQLQAEQRKFEVGTSTNFNVLNFQNQFSSAQLNEVQAIINLQTAIAQLELTKGTLLQYFGVRLGDAGTGGGQQSPLPRSPDR
ncbi:MAG: TolC family protein [Acidobacteriota bacterium]|jgi:outer membrane protein TolC